MILEYLIDKVVSNDKVFMSAFGGAVLFVLMSNESATKRIVGGLCGFITAVMFSPWLAQHLSDGEGAHVYSAGIAICGQFVPQLIQTTITKVKHTDIYEFLKRVFKK